MSCDTPKPASHEDLPTRKTELRTRVSGQYPCDKRAVLLLTQPPVNGEGLRKDRGLSQPPCTGTVPTVFHKPVSKRLIGGSANRSLTVAAPVD